MQRHAFLITGMQRSNSTLDVIHSSLTLIMLWWWNIANLPKIKSNTDNVCFYRELFIQRENTTLQERHLDYETNGYIACKKCGEVNAFQDFQFFLLFIQVGLFRSWVFPKPHTVGFLSVKGWNKVPSSVYLLRFAQFLDAYGIMVMLTQQSSQNSLTLLSFYDSRLPLKHKEGAFQGHLFGSDSEEVGKTVHLLKTFVSLKPDYTHFGHSFATNVVCPFSINLKPRSCVSMSMTSFRRTSFIFFYIQ